MSGKTPSILALLGLAAVAGYQNRDALAGFAKRLENRAAEGAGTDGGITETLHSGLNGLVGRLRETTGLDLSGAVESWVGPGANRPISPEQAREALGPDLIRDLVERTGLSEDDLLNRLAKALPETIDRMTPDGRLPTRQEFATRPTDKLFGAG